MAKISIKDAGKFTESNNTEFFTLKDNMDVAIVRFLYEDPDGADLDFFLVHEVKYKNDNDKEVRRYVNCIGYDDEGHRTGDCPLCNAGKKPQEKLFMQLYNEDEGKLQIWERGKNFVPQIVSFLNRYGALINQSIEVERHGKKGDTNTSYQLFAYKADNKTLADFPEKQQLLGGFIVDASIADMNDILDENYSCLMGKKDDDDSKTEDTPRRERRQQREEEPSQRRNRRRNDTDTF